MKFARGFSEFVPDSTAAVSDVDANLSWAIRNSRSANSALEVFPHSLWLGRHSPRKAKLSETEYRSDYSEQDGRCAINFSQAGIAVGNIEPFPARLRPSLNVAPGAEGHARSSTVSSCPDFHAGYSRRQASGHVARSVHWRCAVSGRRHLQSAAKSRHCGRLAISSALQRHAGACRTGPGHCCDQHITQRDCKRHAVRQAIARRSWQCQRVGLRCALDQHFAFRRKFHHACFVAAGPCRACSGLFVGLRPADFRTTIRRCGCSLDIWMSCRPASR